MLPVEIENRLSEIREEVEKMGAELVDVGFRKAGRRGVLTIIADKKGGITLEDCAQINRRLGDYFDGISEELIHGSYFLEVNSPGLDRPLKNEKDFSRAIGQKVKVTYREDDGKISQYVGEIYEIKDSMVRFIRPGDSRIFWVKMNTIMKAVREISLIKSAQ